MKRLLWFTLLLTIPAATAQEPTIQLTEQTRYVNVSAQTLSGQVSPAEALLTMNGNPVTVDGDGRFAVAVTLQAGMNTFIFRAASEGDAEVSAKLDVFLDTQPPDLQITAPVTPFYTNQSLVHVYGTVRDMDPATTLERDGTEVSLENGRFVDTLTDLADGAHQLVYQARDGNGQTGQITANLFVDTTAPSLDLVTPVTVAPNASFPVTFTMNPEEDVRQVRLSVANQLVYESDSGAPFAQNFTHDGSSHPVAVVLTVVDRYGNRAHSATEIPVAHPNYVYGKVLDDQTSFPLAGIQLRLRSPAGEDTVVTDSDGRYSSHLPGEPLTVTNVSSDYVALSREVLQAGGGFRVTDLRLTRRATAQSASLPFQDAALSVSLDGFAGGARVTAFGDQALPALLPTGYVPLAGFELADVTGTGQATLTASIGGTVPVGAPYVLLEAEGSGWRVLKSLEPAGAVVQTVVEECRAGAYLVAFRDTEIEAPAPQAGDVLARRRFQLVGENRLYQSTTDPSAVSLIESPNTRVSLLVQGDDLRSGALARVKAQAFHQRFSGDLRPEPYEMDVFCYRHGFQRGDARHLRGTLSVTSREAVSLETTRYAQIRFSPLPGEIEQGGYHFEARWNLGSVEVDLGAQDGSPRAVRILADDGSLPPMDAGSVLVKAFVVDLDRPLDQAPQLTVAEPQTAAMVLLKQVQGDQWAYAGRLTFADDRWTNDPATTAFTDSGHYALVALPYPITEIQGAVRHNGSSVADALVRGNAHPWLSRSNEAGVYRAFVPRAAHLWTLTAVAKAGGLTAARRLPVVAELDVLTDQDFALAEPELALVAHQPAQNQQHLDLMPEIRLEFSHLLRFDPDLWQQAITLTTAGGDGVPLHILEDTAVAGVRIRPRQTLAEATDYRLRVGTELESAQGGRLAEPVQVEFRTKTLAVTGSLDLTRFSLSWENETMALVAPAEAYPANTELLVFNPANAFSVTETLVGGGYRRQIDAQPGDVVHLTATLPDGRIAALSIDVVRTGPNRIRLGSQGFRYEVAPGLVLNVHRVNAGAGTELQIGTISEAVVRESIAAAASMPSKDPQHIVKMLQIETTDGTPLPDFEGFIETDIDPATEPDGTLVLYSFVEDILAPANPLEPDVLTPHTFAEPHSGQAIQGGRLQSKRNDTHIHEVVFGFGFSLGATHRVPSIKVAILKEGSGFAYHFYRVRTLREDVRDQDFEVEMFWAHHAPWWHPLVYPGPNDGAKDWYPIREAFVYRADPSLNGVHFSLMGMSNAVGVCTYGAAGEALQSIRVVDPSTGVMGEALANTRSVLNQEGYVISLTLFPTSKLTARAAYLPFEVRRPDELTKPKITLAWEVIDYEDGEAVVNEWATEEFKARGRFAREANRSLRVTLTGSESLEKVRVGGSWFETFEGKGEQTLKSIQIDIPQGMEAGQAKHHVELLVTDLRGQTQRFVRDIWALGRFGNLPSLATPPAVVASIPKDGDRDILIREPLTLYFSEPVNGIGEDTVVLHNKSTGENVALLYLDADGLLLTDQHFVDACVIVPQTALAVNSQYELRVEGLADQSGDRLEQTDSDGGVADHYAATFNTAETQPHRLVHLDEEEQSRGFASYRNLLVMAEPATREPAVSFYLKVFDTQVKAGEQAPVVAQTPVPGGFGEHRFEIEMFTPDVLAAAQGFEGTVMGDRNLIRANDLPVGTLVVVKTTNRRTARGYLHFFEYMGAGGADGGGAFRRIVRMNPAGDGALNTIGRAGPYLAVGYQQMAGIEDAGGNVVDVQRGGTRVYDMREYMDKVHELERDYQNGEFSLAGYNNRLQRLGLLFQYYYPGDPGDLEGFLWKQTDGPRPGLLSAAISYPGLLQIGRWNRDGGMPFFSGAFWDFRNIARTLYPNQSPFPQSAPAPGEPGRAGRSKRRCFAVENLDVFENGELLTRDIAVFSEYDHTQKQGYVYLYEVPRQADTSRELKPRIGLVLKNGYRQLSVDRRWGFLAFQDLDNRISVMDIRSLWNLIDPDQEITVIEIDEKHPALIAEPLARPYVASLFFHSGSLYWSNPGGGGGLERLPLAPANYRRIGWLTYDLGAWMNNADHQRTQASRLTHLDHTVLYASDTFLEESNEFGFVMEIGSFEIELEAGESASVVFAEQDGSWRHEVKRDAVPLGGLTAFNTVALMEYLRDQKCDDLRAKGAWPFEVTYRIYNNGRVIAEATHDFLVAYQLPQTRYTDAYRQIGSLDSLALYPAFNEQDHHLSMRDPRMNLAPGRMLAADFMFQRGSHGMGMLNAQMLHVAYPAWWTTENFPTGFHDGALSRARLVFEHPGQFHLEAKVEDKGTKVTLLDRETNRFTKERGRWRLQHADNMWYVFKTGAAVPEYRDLFHHLNQHLNGDPDAADKMRYLVFRYPEAEKMPGSLYREAQLNQQIDQPWNNKMVFESAGGLGAVYPTQVTETTGDHGRERRITRTYAAKATGVFVEEDQAQGLTIAYNYDDDGYLTSVVYDPSGRARKTEYAWEETGFRVGDLVVKRLSKITHDASPGSDLVTHYEYTDSNRPLRVTQFTTPYGLKEVEATPLTGLPQAVVIEGLASVPDQQVQYRAQDGMFLSSRHAVGEQTFGLVWERRAMGDKGYLWFLVENKFRDQSFDYDDLGNLTEHHRDEGKQSWVYDGPQWFKHMPTEFTDPLGQTFSRSMDVTSEGGTMTQSDGTVAHVSHVSGSGVVYRTTNHLQVAQGARHSENYVPAGGGLRVENGRLTEVRLDGVEGAVAAYTYNRFGEVDEADYLGVTHRIESRDRLGRPVVVQTGEGETQRFSYSYVNGLQAIHLLQEPSGSTQMFYTDEWGRLVREDRVVDEGTLTYRYEYDALNRLHQRIDASEPANNVTYEYFGNSDVLSEVRGPMERLRYESNSQVWNPSISSLSIETAGKHRDEVYAVDALGRQIRGTMNQVGPVSVEYTGFGLLKSVLDDQEQGITLQYGDKQVTVVDAFRSMTTVTEIRDNAGLSTVTKRWGNGLDEAQEVEQITRSVGSGPHGLELETATHNPNSGIRRESVVNGLGGFVRRSVNAFEQEALAFNRFGRPTQTDGMLSQQFEFDDRGRLGSWTNANGQTVDQLTYDVRDRLTDYRNLRGKMVSLAYQHDSSRPETVEVEGKSRFGGDVLETYRADDPLSGWVRDWKGEEIQAEAVDPEGLVRILRGAAAGKKATAAEMRFDRTKGVLTSITDFSGQVTQMHWDDYGRKLNVYDPDHHSEEYHYSGLGQLRRYFVNGEKRLDISRDDENRLDRVETPTASYDWHYQKNSPLMDSITGGRYPIHFRNYNHQGKPGLIDVGEGLYTVSMAYHPDGSPSCVISKTKGGLPVVQQFNILGDLTYQRRGLEPATTYEYNSWGAPASMRIGGGEPLTLFGEGDQFNLSLPGGAVATIDEAGNYQSLTPAGLARKTFSYDPSNRLERIVIGARELRRFDYEATTGQLTQITATGDLGVALWTYDYDPENGRLSEISVDGRARSSWTYQQHDPDLDRPVDGDRIETYTDGNGVVTRYAYNDAGQTTLIDIQTGGGPSFNFDYDPSGHLALVASMGLSARFEAYSDGWPQRMIWGNGIGFEISQEEGRLQSITQTDGDLGLTLTWTEDQSIQDCDTANLESQGPLIGTVHRAGPAFRETMVVTYDDENRLDHVAITRESAAGTQTIEEQYGPLNHKMASGLVRHINQTRVLNSVNGPDPAADQRRVASQISAAGTTRYTYDPELGNLTEIQAPDGGVITLKYDGFRRLREIGAADTGMLETYRYDHQARRISAATRFADGRLVYAYQGSRVIAIGIQPWEMVGDQLQPAGAPRWTHAIGYGPWGPVFMKDLTGGGFDYYLLTDHLGTPFAYHAVGSGTVYYTPTNPWGELLARYPDRAPHYAGEGDVTTAGFELPPDPVFPFVPLGLGGHLYEHDTGLVYMHHRFYHPRLSHFINPDFRAPDIYDPTTLSEPYAYAAGNPVMFWDPDGLSAEAFLNKVFGKELFALGLAYGITKETLLGMKDLLVLGVRMNHARYRIALNESLVRLGKDPLKGIDDDKAFMALVQQAMHELFIDKGIFQQIGEDAGNSLADSVHLAEQNRPFAAGAAATGFVDAITLLASLPKAGLSASRKVGGSITKKLDSIPQLTKQLEMNPDRYYWADLENGFTKGEGFHEPNTIAEVVRLDAAEILEKGQGRSKIAVARTATEEHLSPAFTNLPGRLTGKNLFPGIEKNNSDFATVVDEEAYIGRVRELYAKSGNPLSPEVESIILEYARRGPTPIVAGVPGLHAEVQAVNWMVGKKGVPVAHTTVATYKLVGKDRGHAFKACVNCTGILNGRLTIITGINGTGSGLVFIP